MTTDRYAQEQAIAADLELCDTALGVLKGRKARAPFLKQRRICIAQIKAWNAEDGTDKMPIDEILAELGGY